MLRVSGLCVGIRGCIMSVLWGVSHTLSVSSIERVLYA